MINNGCNNQLRSPLLGNLCVCYMLAFFIAPGTINLPEKPKRLLTEPSPNSALSSLGFIAMKFSKAQRSRTIRSKKSSKSTMPFSGSQQRKAITSQSRLLRLNPADFEELDFKNSHFQIFLPQNDFSFNLNQILTHRIQSVTELKNVKATAVISIAFLENRLQEEKKELGGHFEMRTFLILKNK